MQDVTGVTTYLWDNAGRQVGVVNGQSKALTYTLDAVGNRTVLLDPDGGLTSYSYDQQNRLTGIANPYNEITTKQYDALDREQKKTLGNGMIVSHLYDAAGREVALWNVGPTGVGLAIYTALYDAAGNRLNNVELDGTRVTWAYDPSYQLTSEQRSGVNAYNTTYLYDPVGNRTVKNDSGALTTCLYNVANELTLMTPPTGQPTTSLWDANGNLLSENVGGSITTYSWEGENRLVGVAYPTGVPDTFAYSNDGLRQKKVTAAGVVEFVWDQQNVLLETDGSGVTQAHYTDFPGYWAGLASQRRSGASNFFGFDQQANSRLLVTAGDVISDSYLYRAFGEEVTVSGSTVNPFRFGAVVQYYRDLANRLYIRARVLEPTLGRWMSRDPLGIHYFRTAAYAYVSNQPTRYTDQVGLLPPGTCQGLCSPSFIVDPELYPACVDICDNATTVKDFVELFRKYASQREPCVFPLKISDCLRCPGRRQVYWDQCGQCCAKLGSPTDQGSSVNNVYNRCVRACHLFCDSITLCSADPACCGCTQGSGT